MATATRNGDTSARITDPAPAPVRATVPNRALAFARKLRAGWSIPKTVDGFPILTRIPLAPSELTVGGIRSAIAEKGEATFTVSAPKDGAAPDGFDAGGKSTPVKATGADALARFDELVSL
ncbi:hypothetical protein [Urbifossiella limnaea]|uniref:Uncharacterized protein n=1 Tax=Urbifossiella limnaea TaxID=2528023 RepID=A0A517XLT2_9BACT|nr:hypothetical protein [Urbifossiella limnaea]QDU18465.1 hypothetical protein ETAA1_03530 [Urbifossiella limnaea]